MTEYVVVECEVAHKTEKAVCIHYEPPGEVLDIEECWVPLSVCEAPDTIEKGDEELTVAKWYADREGLPY